jgi:hypothetical protein
MMKPYFKTQTPSKCGCYYPDCTRLGDDGRGHRLMLCIRHGFLLFTMRRNKLNPDFQPLALNKLPTKAWREKERRRLQKADGQ